MTVAQTVDNIDDPAALTFSEVRRLGLEVNIAELDAFGYTTIEADRVAPPAFHARARQALLTVHQRRSGQHIDDSVSARLAPPGGAVYHELLLEDPTFEEMLLNPVVVALARYLTGRSTILSNMFGILKDDQFPTTMGLHTDTDGVPPPFPQYAQVCNVTWALSSYTEADGALAIVPGSHRYCRPPRAEEVDAYRPDSPIKPIPVEVEAGSLIVWHGNTWHGAYMRTNPGVRLTAAMYFCRPYYRTQTDIASHVTDEMLERNPQEFATLVGRKVAWPLERDGRNRFGLPGPPQLPRGCGDSVWS